MKVWPVREDRSWWNTARHLVQVRLTGTVRTIGEKTAWAAEVRKCPQKVRLWIADQLLEKDECIEVVAVRDKDGYLTVKNCPICGAKEHYHGKQAGMLVSHCTTDSRVYKLVVKEDARE